MQYALKYILSFTVVLCMLCSCQCGSFETNESGKDSDSLAFHIAVLPTEECDPFYVAQECGIFDSLGVVVKLDTFYAAMDADTAFMNNEVQMMVTDSLKLRYLNSIIKSDSIRALITDTLHLSFMTSLPSRIKTIQNLKDKIVALTRNSALDYWADKTMIMAGLKPEELNRPQINNLELRTKMLNANQYDGAILPEPYASQCEEMGANRILEMKEMLLRVVVKKSVHKNYKEEVSKVIDAYYLAKEKGKTGNVK